MEPPIVESLNRSGVSPRSSFSTSSCPPFKPPGALQTLRLFYNLASPYFVSDRSAQTQLICVVVLSFVSSGLSVIFSYLGRDFWNALSQRDVEAFWFHLSKFMVLLLLAVPIVVLARYMRDRFSCQWRSWMTVRVMRDYFSNRSFYDMEIYKDIDNPDQRISEDIKAFTVVSLRFLLTVMSTIIDFLSFSFVLYGIAPSLFAAAVLYSGIGTWVTVVLGKKLVSLNYHSLQTEADFRYSLVRVRENAESVAFFRGELLEEIELRRLFQRVLSNLSEVMRLERTLEFFTSSYRYLIQILPAAVVAPQYFAGTIELGVVSQSYGAFNHILNDMSLIVTQFEDLTAFAAGIDRLEQMVLRLRMCKEKFNEMPGLMSNEEGGISDLTGSTSKDTVINRRKHEGANEPVLSEKKMEDVAHVSSPTTETVNSRIQLIRNPGCPLAIRDLSLMTPNGNRTLIKHLNLALGEGTERLLIVGTSGAGKSSLLRAISGLWSNGQGTVRRPPDEQTFFLPQKPYCPLGTLRDQLMYPRLHGTATDTCHSAGNMASKQCSPRVIEAVRNWWTGDLRVGSLRNGTASFLDATVAWQWRSSLSPASSDIQPLAQRPTNVSDSYLLSVLELVRLGGLSEQLKKDEKGCNPLDCVRDWSDMLSLGEQQRLAFARLLMYKPKLAILDEATSALDIDTERQMYKLLEGVEGMSVVSVGHRPSLEHFHTKRLRLSGPNAGRLSQYEESGSYALEEICDSGIDNRM
eukprot:GHVQ01008594.1.p1 GENE.GHVQ01008594.1~~GHVQ01008594.1.p1  ORF type:complete len:746 (+),score=54.81 GHVQ01008594.1:245-2482(+)